MNKQRKVLEINSHVYWVDPRGSGPFDMSGVYIIIGDGLTLIETSGSLTIPQILDSVEDMGYKATDIRHAIVTHIHIDHAGAAGSLVRIVPEMKVYVHEKGAKHLIDPSKLIKSAETVYGSRERVVALHGEIIPVPKENVIAVKEANVDIGSGLSLTIFNAPGHAPHHIGIFESNSGCLFPGEALGHYYPESDMITTAVAPPAFNLEDSIGSLKKIRELEPKIVCFSQYGPHEDPLFVVEETARILNFHDDFIRRRLEEGISSEAIVEEMMGATDAEKWGGEDDAFYMLTSTVLGFISYYQRSGILGIR